MYLLLTLPVRSRGLLFDGALQKVFELNVVLGKVLDVSLLQFQFMVQEFDGLISTTYGQFKISRQLAQSVCVCVCVCVCVRERERERERVCVWYKLKLGGGWG